ncbi:unnamed protein product [Closterium sp. NIES-64]|nr:unnamed protein product [Closterium sp. NIES-64]
MYALPTSADRADHLCVPPDPSIEPAALAAGEAAALGASESPAPGTGAVAALGASESASSGASESALSGTASAPASHTFTLDSGASCSFFQDRTTLTTLGRPVAVSLADPSGGPVLAHFSTVLPCPAAPSSTLSGLYLPSFSTNLVSGADLQDAGVHQFTPASQRVAASGQVFAAASRSGPESAPCSCHLLSHETLLWHHRLGHPSLLRLQSMASRVLVSGLPRSLPPLPPGPGPSCVPCVEGQQRAAPHSSQFPPTEAPLQTLHMDTFTLPDSPQQNGIAERRIGMVKDAARTSMMHAAAPHFLWPFAVRYAAHQINLQPRVSMPETSPALLWTGKVGDASAFRVWGSQAFVCDLSADKLSLRAAPCVFLGFPRDAPGWQFYHPTSRRVLSSQDVMFNESVPYYRLFPYRTPSLPPPPLFLVPSPPLVDPLPPQSPAPSGVSQVDIVEFVEVAGNSGAAEGAEPGGADSGGAERVGATPGGAEPGGAEPGGAEPGGAEPGGAEPGVAEPGSAEPRGAEPRGATPGGATPGGPEPRGAEPEGVGLARVASGGAVPGGSSGASFRREPLSPHELREWFARRWRRAAGARGAAGTGGSAAAEGAGVAGPGGARTGSTGAAGLEGTSGAGAAAGVGAESTTVGPGGGPAGGATGAAGGTGVGGAAGAGAAARGTGAVPAMSGVAARPRLYFPVPSQLQLQPASLLPAPSPYTGPTGGLAERREPASRPASPVRAARTSGRGSRQRPHSVPGTYWMSLRPSTAPLRAPLPSPPGSSFPALADPESDSLRAASPTGTRLLATVVTDPSFESTAAFALVAELVDFAARCRLDYAASLVAESESVCPPSVGGTYVDEVPPPGANIVSGMWIFRVKRPPGSPPVFKARYVARGFSQRQGVDYFQTFSPTPKMTTLWVLLHVGAHRDYELHSLDFSTAFLQRSLHEEIWLRRPHGFIGTFPPGTQWSLRRPVNGLRHAPREWHDKLRTTLAALGFAPFTADPSLFLRTDTSLPPFYILVYVDDLVFATANTAGLAYVKSEL